MVRQENEDVDGAVKARAVVVAVRAVDVGDQGAGRGIVDRVEEAARVGAGDQVDEVLVVAIGGRREVLQRAVAELDVHVGLVRLQDAGGGGNLDRFGDQADLQGDVDAGDGVDGHHHAVLDEGAEAGLGQPELVVAGEKVLEEIAAGFVAVGPPLLAAGGVGNLYSGRWNRGTAGVQDRAHDGSVEHLGRGRLQAQRSRAQSEKNTRSHHRSGNFPPASGRSLPGRSGGKGASGCPEKPRAGLPAGRTERSPALHPRRRTRTARRWRAGMRWQRGSRCRRRQARSRRRPGTRR